MLCFNTENHHHPHTRKEVQEDVFQFVANLNADTGLDVDPEKVWDEMQSKIMNCLDCHHPKHRGECGALITEDIRVGRGTYDPVGFHWRSQIVGTCHCGLLPAEVDDEPN